MAVMKSGFNPPLSYPLDSKLPLALGAMSFDHPPVVVWWVPDDGKKYRLNHRHQWQEGIYIKFSLKTWTE